MRGRPQTSATSHHIARATDQEKASHPGCFGQDAPTVFVATTRYGTRPPLTRYLCAGHGRTFADRHNLTIPAIQNSKGITRS